MVTATPSHTQVKISWLEKLGRWQDALQVYERTKLTEPRAPEYGVGQMRCLSALSEWEKLSKAADKLWPMMSAQLQAESLSSLHTYFRNQYTGTTVINILLLWCSCR